MNIHGDVAAAYDRLSQWYDLMYLAQGERPAASHPALVESVAALMAEIGARSVLDASCGTGNPIVGLASDYPELSVCGCDASAAMLSQCRRNAHEVGLTVESLPRSGPGELGLAQVAWQDLHDAVERRFDLVLCRGHGLYHERTREAVVGAIRSLALVCRAGGSVLVDTLRWGPGLRSEAGRGPIKFRGFVPEHEDGEGHSDQFVFVDSIDFSTDPCAVSGVLQRKTLHVLRVGSGRMKVESEVSVIGAPFSLATLMEMMSEAGLSDVRPLDLKGQRYDVALGTVG